MEANPNRATKPSGTTDDPYKDIQEELFEVVIKWYNQETTPTPFRNGYPGLRYHELNYDLDKWVIKARSEGHNPRVALLTPAERQEADQDLLRVKDQTSKMAFLDSFHHTLIDNVSELKNDPKGAIIVVTLIGGHCARIDSNAAAAERVLAWSIRKAGGAEDTSGEWAPTEIASLRVVEVFSKTADLNRFSPRGLLDSLTEVSTFSWSKLTSGLTKESLEAGCEYLSTQQRWLLIQLTDVLASLPAKHLRQKLKEEEGEKELEEGQQDNPSLAEAWLEHVGPWFTPGHGMALFHQHQARVLLSLGWLAEARAEIDLALKHAKPHMLHSIEASRRMQLVIDMEEISRTDIAKEVKDEVTEKVTDKVNLNIKKENDQQRLQTSNALRKERETTTEEIQGALLRVVEVLGIFLGVAGIAITAVGGIVVEGSFWNRALIWGLGYGSVVSLFWLLRIVAGLPGAREMIRNRKKIKSLEAALDAKAPDEDLNKDAASSANVATEGE